MKKRIAAIFIIFLILIIAATTRMHVKNELSTGTSKMLTRGTEIYPTVQVNGELYEWRKGSAIIRELPDGVSYYGELDHVEGTAPNNDREFVSAFDASGQIYTMENSNGSIYVCLTTDTSWLENTVVTFDHITENRADAGGQKWPTDLFIEVCDNLFADGTNYEVIDENGCDVTEQFLKEHRSEYRWGKYDAISDAVIDNHLIISWPGE